MERKRALLLVAFRGLDSSLSSDLEKAGFEVHFSDSLPAAREQLAPFPIASVLLVCPEDSTGFREFLAHLYTLQRESRVVTAVAVCRDQYTEAWHIELLRLGAEAVIPFPVNTKLLSANMTALSRRLDAESPLSNYIDLDGLVIDFRGHRVLRNGQEVPLTHTEFKILQLLATQKGKIFGRREILHQLRGEETMVEERTVDVHVYALRRKLGAYGDRVETVERMGYRLRAPDDPMHS